MVVWGGGGSPLEVQNDFFCCVFEKHGCYLSSSQPSCEPVMRSRMVVSFTCNNNVVVLGGGTDVCVFGAEGRHHTVSSACVERRM